MLLDSIADSVEEVEASLVARERDRARVSRCRFGMILSQEDKLEAFADVGTVAIHIMC